MMEEDELKRREQVRGTMAQTMYYSMAGIFPLLLLILFVIAGNSENPVPFSFGAFVQPYVGEQATMMIALGAFAAMDFLLINLYMIPLVLKSTGNEITALTLTETFGIFGFIIGFMNYNPWAAIPFMAIGLGNYAYVFMKIREKQASPS